MNKPKYNYKDKVKFNLLYNNKEYTLIDEGDVLSLDIFERAKALREKNETWRRAYNKVIEEHDRRIDNGEYARNKDRNLPTANLEVE